jgi:hypothetical protein
MHNACLPCSQLRPQSCVDVISLLVCRRGHCSFNHLPQTMLLSIPNPFCLSPLPVVLQSTDACRYAARLVLGAASLMHTAVSEQQQVPEGCSHAFCKAVQVGCSHQVLGGGCLPVVAVGKLHEAV